MKPMTVMLSIDTTSESEFVEAFERLARITAGEILTGRTARISAFPTDDED